MVTLDLQVTFSSTYPSYDVAATKKTQKTPFFHHSFMIIIKRVSIIQLYFETA